MTGFHQFSNYIQTDWLTDWLTERQPHVKLNPCFCYHHYSSFSVEPKLYEGSELVLKSLCHCGSLERFCLFRKVKCLLAETKEAGKKLNWWRHKTKISIQIWEGEFEKADRWRVGYVLISTFGLGDIKKKKKKKNGIIFVYGTPIQAFLPNFISIGHDISRQWAPKTYFR